jgi:hypothetical protein
MPMEEEDMEGVVAAITTEIAKNPTIIIREQPISRKAQPKSWDIMYLIVHPAKVSRLAMKPSNR